MKICKCCNIEKPKTDFYKHSHTKDRLRPKCRKCTAVDVQAWERANSDKKNRSNREWSLANPEKRAEFTHKWSVENPGKKASNARNRRAKIILSGGTHDYSDIIEMLSRQRGLCASCENKLFKSGAKKYHVDHIMPLSKGGSNDKYNLQCLCPPCNLKKHAKDPIAWANENGRLL